MYKYDVIIRNVKSGIEEKVDQITASSQDAAKRIAVQTWFSQINMINEQIFVVRNDHQKPMIINGGI